jgi:multicomponent Na+:H+ antiporter subunit D
MSLGEVLRVLPPGSLLVLGAVLLLFLRGRALQVALLALPVLSFLHLRSFPLGYTYQLPLFDFVLTPIRIDKLSLVWGYVYHTASFLGALYMLQVKTKTEHVAAMGYAGSAIVAAFAGDLVTLFVFWELTALTSVFLILARRTPRALRAGQRYLLIQVTSGVLLLAGALLHFASTRSLAFNHIGLESPGGTLIFLAFGIKCAFPLLHNWLQDAYPEATVGGTVMLSAFTTKLAVYALARGYAGTELLIPIGAAMTLFPIVFAVIENDLRRVLSYSLNNQLGFMVVGVGIGTELAINGAAAHAFAHIVYKGLLFMAMGAVLLRTGTTKATELGGLYKSMPFTTAMCIVGSLSISGVPLFSGFVTKSMTLTAAAGTHMVWLTIALLVASAGVVDHSGIKIPFFAFFAHDSGKRVKEAPLNMLLAMAAAATLCVGIGVYPQALYDILPYTTDYVPFTTSHVMTTLQLLLFAALAFTLMWKMQAKKMQARKRWGGVKELITYPPELPSTNLDSDWMYRRALPWLGTHVGMPLLSVWVFFREAAYAFATETVERLRRANEPPGALGEPWPVGKSATWTLIVFGVGLTLLYVTL